MTEIPSDQHITYQLQYRKCGKTSCGTCRNGQGHGPYWYAYWREGARLRSGYVGKVHPNQQKGAGGKGIGDETSNRVPTLQPEGYVATPALI